MNWTETETVITICTGIVTLTQFLLWRYIARSKSYESEKGKNLATKEDIGDITKEIESIKECYNNSLEKYKIGLQLEFEQAKYMIGLCNKIDERLIELLIFCVKSIEHENLKIDPSDKFYIKGVAELGEFLKSYKYRYGHIKYAQLIIKQYESLFALYQLDNEGSMYTNQYKEAVVVLENSINNFLSLFLPKFDITNMPA